MNRLRGIIDLLFGRWRLGWRGVVLGALVVPFGVLPVPLGLFLGVWLAGNLTANDNLFLVASLCLGGMVWLACGFVRVTLVRAMMAAWRARIADRHVSIWNALRRGGQAPPPGWARGRWVTVAGAVVADAVATLVLLGAWIVLLVLIAFSIAFGAGALWLPELGDLWNYAVAGAVALLTLLSATFGTALPPLFLAAFLVALTSPSAATPAAVPEQLTDASLLGRVAAKGIDVGGLVVTLGLPVLVATAQEIPTIALAGLVATALLTAYQAWGIATRGQSIGKRVVGIRIVDSETGGPPGAWRGVCVRQMGISVACLWSGPLLFGWYLVDALIFFLTNRRCAHDHLAGTRVVIAR